MAGVFQHTTSSMGFEKQSTHTERFHFISHDYLQMTISEVVNGQLDYNERGA